MRPKRADLCYANSSGGKFTLRLQHPITPVLYESLLFSLIGNQFEEADGVVGCVLSARQSEDILSVWVEEEGESVRNGSLRSVTYNPPSITADGQRENHQSAQSTSELAVRVPLESSIAGVRIETLRCGWSRRARTRQGG